MRHKSEQRKDEIEVQRTKRIQVDLEAVLAADSLTRGSLAPRSLKWADYKDSLQQFYDGRGLLPKGSGPGRGGEDKDLDDLDATHTEVPAKSRAKHEEEADVSQLPEEFFQSAETFDAMDYVLRNLPSHMDDKRLLAYIHTQVEQKELLKDRVAQDLTAVVMEKYDTFVAGMQTMRDMNNDLSTANVFASNSRRLLTDCKARLVASLLRVVHCQRQRQRLVSLRHLVAVLARAQALRTSMQQAVRERRLDDAVQAYTNMHRELCGKSELRLSAINDIRDSLPKYQMALQAYMLLDEHSQKLLETTVAEPKPMTVLITSPGRMCVGEKVTVRSMAQTMVVIGGTRIRELVEKNNWTSVSDMLECHEYVKKVVQHMKSVWNRLDSLQASMPPTAVVAIWAHLYNEVLVEVMEGFAAVRKCNPAGRGMMKMDLTAIVRGITLVHPVDHSAASLGINIDMAKTGKVPTQESIDAYINAFYFDSHADLMQWVKANAARYHKRWMVGLAMVGVGAKMKPHQRNNLKKEISAIYA